MVAIRNNVLGCAEQMHANAMRLCAHLCLKSCMMRSDVDLEKNDCILKKNDWNSGVVSRYSGLVNEARLLESTLFM